jgi:hypothetical protein
MSGRNLRRSGLACVFALVACTDLDIQDPGPLMITLTATPTSTTAGSSVTFQFHASGTELSGIALFYGDGVVDSIPTYLARTADGNRAHLYETPGSYIARVTVIDTRFDQAEDTVTVQIAPAGVPAARR